MGGEPAPWAAVSPAPAGESHPSNSAYLSRGQEWLDMLYCDILWLSRWASDMLGMIAIIGLL